MRRNGTAREASASLSTLNRARRHDPWRIADGRRQPGGGLVSRARPLCARRAIAMPGHAGGATWPIGRRGDRRQPSCGGLGLCDRAACRSRLCRRDRRAVSVSISAPGEWKLVLARLVLAKPALAKLVLALGDRAVPD